jgi:ABC-type multidrug transport system ATPase subunit
MVHIAHSVNQQPAALYVACTCVSQEDVIMDTMTVREALLFAAKLKLPREMSNQEKVGG